MLSLLKSFVEMVVLSALLVAIIFTAFGCADFIGGFAGPVVVIFRIDIYKAISNAKNSFLHSLMIHAVLTGLYH